MTISHYLSEFLKLYETIKIDTNHVQDGSDKYGLFKSPSRDISKAIGETSTITEYYQFFAFQNSICEAERKEDDEWLEDFIYFIDDFPFNYNYPNLDKGRTVTDISATGSPTPFSDTDKGIMYQISLSITYEREAQ